MNLSKRTLTTLAKQEINLNTLTDMTIEELQAIKGVGPKMIQEIQMAMIEDKTEELPVEPTDSGRIPIELAKEHADTAILFHKPKVTTTWLTVNDIANAKANLLMTSKVTEALENKADAYHEYAFRQFIEYDEQRLVDILNQMHAIEEHLQIEVGRLSYKLSIKRNSKFTTFHNHMVAPICALMIVQSLIDIKVISQAIQVIAIIDEDTGRKTWKNQTTVTYGIRHKENESFVHGVTTEPCILQKRTKVRPGGTALKLSGGERMFLKNAGATPLRLINLDEQEMVDYLESNKWYLKVLRGTVNMDKIIADMLIEKQVKKFMLVQKLESFYLPMWMDYRTRLYYETSELGFNPHGKTFETSLYELAEPRYITNVGFDALAYSAATIIDGRMAHHTAIEKFTANKEHYLQELRRIDLTDSFVLETTDKEYTTVPDFGPMLYNRRLAQAIEDYYSETPSRFLLGEDATNGGLQHGGIGFRSPEMMIPANVGGDPLQRDSHGDLQTRLGLATRQEAKDIHQPLLHGSSIKTVAKVLDKSVPETIDMLREGYGDCIFNIPMIAEWGTQAVDNHNTSLKWTTIDGFKAQSIAYTESVPLTLYGMTTGTESGYMQIKMYRDMPLIQDRKGRPVYGAVEGDTTMGKANKLRGLYANITHSIDGANLRSVIREIKIANGDQTAGGIYKHDNFLTHPNDMCHVRNGYKKFLLRSFEESLYSSALKQISSNIKNPTIAPTLTIGAATPAMIEDSHYYLAP